MLGVLLAFHLKPKRRGYPWLDLIFRRGPFGGQSIFMSKDFSGPLIEIMAICGSKLSSWGKPQVLVHVSTCQGSILGTVLLATAKNINIVV